MHRETIRFSRSPARITIRSDRDVEQQTPVEVTPDPQEELQRAEEQVSSLLKSIEYQLREYEVRRDRSLDELQQLAIELSVTVASHIVGREIDSGQHDVEGLVTSAINHLNPAEKAVVHLHPLDISLLEERIAQSGIQLDDSRIQLRPDTSVSRGGVQLNSESGRIVMSDVLSRISQVREIWMENLDDAQIERRSASATGGSVRRFPDRRETA